MKRGCTYVHPLLINIFLAFTAKAIQYDTILYKESKDEESYWDWKPDRQTGDMG